MGLVYLPTWMVDVYGIYVGRYTRQFSWMLGNGVALAWYCCFFLVFMYPGAPCVLYFPTYTMKSSQMYS